MLAWICDSFWISKRGNAPFQQMNGLGQRLVSATSNYELIFFPFPDEVLHQSSRMYRLRRLEIFSESSYERQP